MGLFDMTDHAMDGLDTAHLTTQTDKAMIGLILSLLESNGIPHMLRQGNTESERRIVGEYGTIYNSIYVKQSDLPRAQELLLAYVGGDTEPSPDQE